MKFKLIEDVEMSNEYDSEGNQLSVKQAEFFKNSKVRDSQGRLLVCYHGSPSKNIDTFITFTGAFFSPSAEYASAYMFDKFTKKKGKLYKVYLNITDPFDNSTKEMNDLTNEFVEWLKQREYTTYDEKFFKESPPHFVIVDDLYCFMRKSFRTGKSKYDGIVVNEEGSSPPISFVPLYPNQIKSITNKAPANSDNINEGI